MALAFESQSCRRCLGSGRHSWCQRYGDVCFGCGGRGEQLTKRGKAAQEFFTASASKPASEFRVGDLIRLTGVTNGGDTYVAFERVTAVTPGPEGRVRIDSERKGRQCSLDTFATSVYREGLSAERKRELLDAALAYQATLTKAGKVPKRAPKAAKHDAQTVAQWTAEENRADARAREFGEIV